MKIGLEHLVIIALVVILLVFILANMNKFSAGENFIQATQNDISEEAGAWSI